MMSLEAIRYESRKAAKQAAKERKEPFVVEAEDLADWKNGQFRSFPFPFIGTYVPKGWETVKDDREDVVYFVDSSGFGGDNEPALSVRRFLDVLEPGFGYAVIEAGQFQVYVGKFRRK